MTRRKLTPDEAKAFWDRVLEEGIKPHSDAIAAIVVAGDVAVVVFELEVEGQLGEESVAGLRGIGWDGQAPVFRMTTATRNRLARNLKNQGDRVSHDWLMSHRKGRVFLWVGAGTFLLNHEPGKGWSLEPGSTDGEYLS